MTALGWARASVRRFLLVLLLPGLGAVIAGELWLGWRTASDAADANALYELLENEVVPAFYDRDRDGRGLPRRWLAIVREAMRSNVPRFSTRRMVKQYVTEMYGPASQARTISDLRS